MVIVLEVQAGPFSGNKIRVPAASCVRVGRNAQSDIAFARDAYMSGAHFSLEFDGADYSITDLNSRNGTFVNGEKVQRAILHDSDTIVAGSTLLALRLYPDGTSPLPAVVAERVTPANDDKIAAAFDPRTAEAKRPDLAAHARRNRRP